MFRHLQSVMDLRILVEKLRHVGQRGFDLVIAGSAAARDTTLIAQQNSLPILWFSSCSSNCSCSGGSWEGSAVIMCIQQFSDGSLRRGALRVARILICGNTSGSRSRAISIPQDRQNRIKRCGVRARQLDYLHVMIWLLVAVSSYAQKSYGRATMRTKFLAMTAVVTSGVIATAFLVQSLSSSSAQTQARQLPEYTASGDLVLPKNFHEWIYVGSPLTPNALNGGEAGFPEYHNVYIEPGSYEIFKKTNEFPEGTILFKE